MSVSLQVRDRVLLLRRTPFGESSLVVQALGENAGRLHLLAKGAHRPSSGYCGVLDLFDSLELSWIPSRTGGLNLLRAGSVMVRRAGIARDLERYRCGLGHLELAELAARPGHEERELFDMLWGSLDRLAGAEVDTQLERIAFDLHFLQNLGLQPALGSCASCGDSRSPGGRLHVAFSNAAGGRLCNRCADQARAAGRQVREVPARCLAMARALLEADPTQLKCMRLRPDQKGLVRDLVEPFLFYHLEHRPRSRLRASGVPVSRGAASIPSLLYPESKS